MEKKVKQNYAREYLDSLTEKDKDEILKKFMKEFFHFPTLRKAGFFTKEMKGDYKAQAKRVCDFFGYKTVFEYRAETVICHLSFAGKNGIDSPEHPTEPFVTVVPSIYQ